MIQKIQKLIRESKKIICITGQEAMIECGGINLWSADNLYRIEKKYGKSPEEMLSAGELTTRKAYFFDFYKNEVLKNLPKPGPAYDAMKVLQSKGKLLGVISFNIYGLEELAGLSPVWELSGSVYDNYCPACKKEYTVDFVKQAKSVPLCDDCKSPVRPNIRLHSEKVRNDLYTQATSACQKADMILVLGTDLSGSKMRYCTGHYTGDKLVVIHKDQHFSDKFADYVIYANPGEVLPKLVEKL